MTTNLSEGRTQRMSFFLQKARVSDMRAPRKRLLLVAAIVLICLIHAFSSTGFLGSSLSSSSHANSTLGFGAIYAVSGAGSSRREHLIRAANVTEIDLTIPKQQAWTDKQVQDFINAGTEETGKGSVYAWLAHNVVLNEFIESGLESALIIEDDVDWDIHLRTVHAPALAAAIRSLGTSKNSYYGNGWDLLYVGNCGDYWEMAHPAVGVGRLTPGSLETVPHKVYPDPTILPRWNLHPYTASVLTALGVPEKSRLVHKSVFPLCTFGYAVTRHAAKRLVEELVPPRAVHSAYDVGILVSCREKGLRCWSVTPELMHHVEGQSIIGEKEGGGFRPPVDNAGLEQVQRRLETSNIGCGFWGRDLDFKNDPKKLASLREEVKHGRCLDKTPKYAL